jgi:chromosomal replication initiation ATPase DnaA
LQKGKVEEFKKNCRSLDLLLVDDIHLLAGKEASYITRALGLACNKALPTACIK